ncbi:MAG: NAD(P)(+) transhydrogenase (Re/Si-specific) subunit beta, partial [Gemmatimonadota bacterium]
MNPDLFIWLAYLLSAVLFIVGLTRLSSPETARTGNAIAALGMLLAIVATLMDRAIIDFTWIVVGLLAGSAAGLVMARTVKMTSMPQMVAVFNGFGG